MWRALILGLLLLGCDSPDDWRRTDSRQIHLYSRPDHFSKNTVHSDDDIQAALQEQETYIAEFEEEFGVVFNESVSVYLYNPDEVNVKAPPGGGYSDPETSTLYYRFFPKALNANGTSGPLGGHEIFHLLVNKTFGTVGSRLLSEGGAVWFNGAYSSSAAGEGWKRKSLDLWMREFSRGEFKTPTELAGDVAQIDEGIFYPQAGLVIKWIVDRFGIKKYSELLEASVRNQALEKALHEVYGVGLEELNRLAEKSPVRSFDEWSDSEFGKNQTQKFYALMREGNLRLLSDILGLSSEQIDSQYEDWVRESLRSRT